MSYLQPKTVGELRELLGRYDQSAQVLLSFDYEGKSHDFARVLDVLTLNDSNKQAVVIWPIRKEAVPTLGNYADKTK